MVKKATIIMPTHDHGELIHSSIRCVLAQTCDDFEFFIIGDGTPEITKQIIKEYQQKDSRISYFDFPKGPRLGEAYRHEVLQKASGKIVCYVADDDIWLPHHVEYMYELLEDKDFAQAFRLTVLPDDKIFIGDGHFDVPWHRSDLLAGRNFVGLTAAAHTLSFYQKLPFGWRTTPVGIPTDLYMWQQFLNQDSCRPITGLRPSVIGLAQALRNESSFEERLDELIRWESFAGSINAEQKASELSLDFLLFRRAELEKAYQEHQIAYQNHLQVVADYESKLAASNQRLKE
jgi:hypothetical protein